MIEIGISYSSGTDTRKEYLYGSGNKQEWKQNSIFTVCTAVMEIEASNECVSASAARLHCYWLVHQKLVGSTLLFHLGDQHGAAHCSNAPLESITRTRQWSRTEKRTPLHTCTPPRCFKSPSRIGCDYRGYCDCYHCLPSRPLSVEHFPVRSFQLTALFTLMCAGGKIAERRLP